MAGRGFGFPFRFTSGDGEPDGSTATQVGEANTRAQVLQLLLTSPGERVMQPAFGCGLKDLVFDPNHDVLAAGVEFTVHRAIERWLGAQVLVAGVSVEHRDGTLVATVAYHDRERLERGVVRITF